jgi:hypothetical protein
MGWFSDACLRLVPHLVVSVLRSVVHVLVC